MISMFGGGLAVGSTVLSLLVIHSVDTGAWLTHDIVNAVGILLAIMLGGIAAALTIRFERAKTS